MILEVQDRKYSTAHQLPESPDQHAEEVLVPETLEHLEGMVKGITGKYIKHDKLAISVEQERNLQGRSKFHKGTITDKFTQAVSFIW